MRLDPELLLMQAVPVFAACSRRDLLNVRQQGEVLRYGAGEVVVREAGAGAEFYVLLVGAASVERAGRPVADLGAGDYFGELALLDPAPRSATVRMRTDGLLLVLGQRAFFEVLREIPDLSRRLLVSTARRLHVADAVGAATAALAAPAAAAPAGRRSLALVP